MNVCASPTPAATNAPATTGTGPTDVAGGDEFLALLNQLTPAVASEETLAMQALATGIETDAGTEESSESLEWALPLFAAPAPPPAEPVRLAVSTADAIGLDADVLQGSAPPSTQATGAVLEAALGEAEAAKASTAEITGPDGPQAAPTAPATPARTEAAATTPSVTRTVHVPVGDSRWPEQVGHEVRLLVERGVQAATLRVSPEHLGPVEVRIDIVNDKANVVFGAAQAETRAALADALPKLREMFAGSGLELGDTGVRQEAPGGNAESSPARRSHGDYVAGEAEPATVAQAAVQVGLVDAYA